MREADPQPLRDQWKRLNLDLHIIRQSRRRYLLNVGFTPEGAHSANNEVRHQLGMLMFYHFTTPVTQLVMYPSRPAESKSSLKSCSDSDSL